MLGTIALDEELAALEASLTAVTSPTEVVLPVRRPPAPVERDNLDEVVAAAIRGETTAVDGLLRFLRPLVVRYCRAKLGRMPRSVSGADDVAQEVCLAVFRALPTYQQLGRPFLSFVYGIAAHKVADVHRANTRDKSDPIADAPDVPSTEDGPEQVTLRHELVEQTGVLLRSLTERQRDILVMRVVMGMSAQETADVIGTTAEAIRVAQHRALNRLRKTLARA
ncbi:RNA polymerase sigma-70 factor [Actinokineospora spheciospongiae]|uniref:RNA polymerase sigma-70 factor n=1 Tax=Actinokineospora spheciospongiae TaxID=909613 RepID=W7IMW8_9PSEU|nr:RNA polymerase sigma factor ShbA [Actinokineospora spheciospongiae]EWC61738.1 RNA polymerase sigma-70 factor [Actinokineospora spheciospongiae]PWW62081.1 RNA polymerase sigma-70 factor (ECF subfamily) [Actinokineospora spheciospongiae]